MNNIHKDIIQFTVIEYGKPITVQSYTNEYRNLMILLRDKVFVEEFGECGGLGRCATCLVRATGLKGTATQKERNEPVTLLKYGIEDNAIRLSCQILITSDIDGSTFEILDQYNR